MGACLGRNRKENSSAVSHGQTRESSRLRNDEINGSPQFSGLTFVIKLLLFGDYYLHGHFTQLSEKAKLSKTVLRF